MFGNIGPWELVFILVIALVVVGPGKLPEVARSLGKAANEFKKVTTGMKRELENAMRDTEEAVVAKPNSVSDKEAAKGEATHNPEEAKPEITTHTGNPPEIPDSEPKILN